MQNEPTPVYRIANWQDHYENKATRPIDRPGWVPQPIQVTPAYRRLVRWPDGNGPAFYGCFRALVGLAMSMSQGACLRGGFLTADCSPRGTPLTMDDMAEAIHMDAGLVSEALKVLASPAIGWVEVIAGTARDGVRTVKGRCRDGEKECGKERAVKVCELISLLQEQPGERRVIVDGYEGGYDDAEVAEERPIKLNANGDTSRFGPHEEWDEDEADEIAVLIARRG